MIAKVLFRSSDFRVLAIFGKFSLGRNTLGKVREYAELAIRMNRKQRTSSLLYERSC